jgi:hypothetical protein
MTDAHRALAVTLYFLGDFKAAQQNAMRGLRIRRSDFAPSPEASMTPAIACLCIEALCEWHFGEIASCQATGDGSDFTSKGVE